MRKLLRLAPLPAIIAILLVNALPAFAAAPDNADNFLCPVVGDGVNNADSHNGDNGVEAIAPPVGTSLLPGSPSGSDPTDNLPVAGNAINPNGPGFAAGGPGDSTYTPIWPK